MNELSGLPFVLMPGLWLLVLTGVCWACGAIFWLRRGAHLPWPERFFLLTAGGLAVFCVALFLLGVCGLLTVTWVSMFAVVAVCLGGLHWWRLLRAGALRPDVPDRRPHALIVLPLLVYWLPELVNSMVPDMGSDALAYHLPMARAWAEQGGLTVNPYLRYPLNAAHMDLLFTAGFIFNGEVLARGFNALMVLLLCFGVYAMAARWAHWVAGLLAVTFLLSDPLLIYLMGTAYVDVGLSLFLLAALHAWLLSRQNDSGWLLYSGFLLAAVMGSKYLGLLYFLTLMPWVGWVLLRQSRGLHWVQFIAVCVLFGCLWYARNVWISGNPVHPFAQGVFGQWLWTDADLLGQNNDLYSKHGVARTLWNFLTLPYTLLTTDVYLKQAPLGVFSVAGLVLSLYVVVCVRAWRGLALFVLLHVALWFFTTQVLRYLVPMLPFFALFAAHAVWRVLLPVAAWMRRYVRLGEFLARWRHAAVVLVFVWSAWHSGTYFHKVWQHRPPPQSASEWRDWRARDELFLLAERAAQHRPNGVLMNFDLRPLFYYHRGLVMGDWYGPANMRTLAKAKHPVLATQDFISQYDVDYLAVSRRSNLFRRYGEALLASDQFELLAEFKHAWLLIEKH